MAELFALVDCNNFFVSCERIFNGKIQREPVVVLSNNDGCVISRSDEVKALSIPMGAPYFKHEQQMKEAGVHVFSANFVLYGDISRRVMLTLESFSNAIEVYSIDEAFIRLPRMKKAELEEFGQAIYERVLQWIGVPVRVGIATTKTLAKIASELSKQHRKPVFVIDPDEPTDALLHRIKVGDVWGVGWQLTKRLHRAGVSTARELRDLSDKRIRQIMNVTGMRTIYELRGISCMSLEHVPATRKSITHSRSFGNAVTRRPLMEEAITAFASRAAAKLRRHRLVPGHMQVYISTGYHGNGPRYSNAYVVNLPQATSFSPTLMKAARAALSRIWRDGYAYKKAGIILLELIPEHMTQTHLFLEQDPRQEALMGAVDRINRRTGSEAVCFASTMPHEKASWVGKSSMRSPRYTTCWDELPVAYC